MNPALDPTATPSAAHRITTVPPAVRRGAWQLPPGRAVTLKASGPTVLGIRQGRVWITRDANARRASEDLVLGPGESLMLARGDRLVMEPWDGFGATWTWAAA